MNDDATTPNPPSATRGPQSELEAEEAARAARHLHRRRARHHLIAVLALAALVRLPLMQFPMGASAGTLAYVGQRWLEGAVPYRDAWDHGAPAAFLMSGLIVRWAAPVVAGVEQGLVRLLMGSQGRLVRITPGWAMPETARLVMMAIDLATLLVVYRIVRRWCRRTEAVVAAGVWAVFGGAILVRRDCLAAGPPVCLLVAAGVLCALRSAGRHTGWLALAGLGCGLAACFDPLALLYLLALVAWSVVVSRGAGSAARRWLVRPGVMVAAALLPVAAFAAWFWSRDALGDLWLNAIVYNVRCRWMPLATRTPSNYWQVIRSLAPEQGALWLFAAGWAIHAFSIGFRPQTLLMTFWGFAAVAAALANRQLDTAAFLQTVPPLAIGAALAITNPSERFGVRDEHGRVAAHGAMLVLLTLALAFGFFYVEVRAYRAHASREETTAERAAAGVADMIRDRTMPGHPIYVWGVGPQLYVLADRPAAHRIFYNRPLNVAWVVNEFFGADVFDDITRALVRTEPVFFVTTEDALPSDPDRDGPLRAWFRHMREHYQGKPWKMEETRPFLVYVRKDRALSP